MTLGTNFSFSIECKSYSLHTLIIWWIKNIRYIVAVIYLYIYLYTCIYWRWWILFCRKSAYRGNLLDIDCILIFNNRITLSLIKTKILEIVYKVSRFFLPVCQFDDYHTDRLYSLFLSVTVESFLIPISALAFINFFFDILTTLHK